MRLAQRVAAIGCSALIGAALAGPAPAQDFYRNKTITMVVGNTAGGGYDANTRVLGRYFGRHVPGNPDVVVQNMPGAASLTSVQWVDATAPKDGTAIVDFNFGLITESKMNPTKIKVDFTKFNWIGSISQDLSVCFVWHTTGIKNLADAQKHPKELHFGLTAVGSSSDVNAKISKNIFKVPLHQVSGYPGSAEQKLAIERGELDGGCGAWSSIPEDWVKQRKFAPLSRSAPSRPADMWSDVPYYGDIAPNDRARQIARLLVAHGDIGRPYIASRTVPPERIKILQDGFMATMQDADFIADLQRSRLPLAPKSGPEALKTVQEIYAAPADIVEEARKVLEE
jgi:tripartite-type tricarboxylate transporter receptor subunit TctC